MLVLPPETVINAYTQGYFPMAESADEEAPIFWYTAHLRGIIPMDNFHISKRSLRYFKKFGFKPAISKSLNEVIENCGKQEPSWINPIIRDTYVHLHNLGYVDSVEVWKDGELAGGLYGLHLGSVFFAESVYQSHDEAHKAAIYFCYNILKRNGYSLWDVQFKTDHLAQFGCIEIPSKSYSKLLKAALKSDNLPFK